ncbi:hypothetical protein [Nonomuraea bangladeshensis]|uniref:hypothetical protein n=1 Tax=Nonomuraea bangladeshensis TaxID=404385 RepID=UPI003C2F80CA
MTNSNAPTPVLCDSSGYGHLADHIDVQRIDTGWQLRIDGHQFPYHLKPEGVIPIPRAETPRLRITLWAHDLEVDNSSGLPAGPDADAAITGKRWIEPHPGGYPTRMATPDGWAVNTRALRGLAGDGLELARLVQVRRYRCAGWQMWIDGILFPYLCGAVAEFDVDNGAMPSVTFDILARRLTADLAALPEPSDA